MPEPRRLVPVLAFVLALCCAVAPGPSAASPAPAGQDGRDERLVRVLEKAKAYCRSLERAALDFICTERIEEITFKLPEFRVDETGQRLGFVDVELVPRRARTNTLVYDYQFVRKGDLKKERRILIEENGRKRNEDDAELTAQSIRVENALFGPIGLLGAEWQVRHDYRIVGEESPDGGTVLVIEAVPKPSLTQPHCFGRVWVREDDGSVVKIAWDQASVGNVSQVEAEALRLGAEPVLTSGTEYGVDKNGLRFPSRDATEEAYRIGNGKPAVRSSTTIVYTDYKFFTVATEIAF